jgi:hypothetical protein
MPYLFSQMRIVCALMPVIFSRSFIEYFIIGVL